jgi:hypothetical protein
LHQALQSELESLNAILAEYRDRVTEKECAVARRADDSAAARGSAAWLPASSSASGTVSDDAILAPK